MKGPRKFSNVVLGSMLMGLCCAVPIVLILSGTAGLAALTGYLDYVLFAALALAIVIGLPLYARHHKRKQDAGFTHKDSEKRDD
ncbi:mercury resistance system transport protein MerF [Halomonas sp. G15]|uniref:Mercuric ion transport protein n=2 Tax=Halomonas TaxID=2745 RepID=A0A4R6H8Y2_9GAMM|nr:MULTISPECIES: mercury resistance system transport protein MerF [Halomonas]MCE0733978.1 mercury resistance system transport protein MerF [Halomonas sp. G15]TDO04338.1 mercuric ion transport protein [Halomonas ventosae]